MNIDAEYEKLEKVGQGSFGTVWKCIEKSSKNIFALKIVVLNPALLKSLLTEILILRDIANHERLVKFYGSKLVDNSIGIFTEFVTMGSLRDILIEKGNLSEKQTAKYTKESLEGLDFLHENNVIHRDIKCGNILLTEHDHIKLTDFGLSKCVENKSIIDNHTFCGTLYFMAPEIIERTGYSSSVDIWALGATVVEMLTGNPIFFSLPPMLFILAIMSLNPAEIKIPNTSKDLNYFLKLVFVKDASKRPKARDLLRSKFLLNVE